MSVSFPSPPTTTNHRPSRRKSGAHHAQLVKQPRFGKKDTESLQMQTNLMSEAESVILKMVDHKRTLSYRHDAPNGKNKCPNVDPRMKNASFVFDCALKRYVKNCMSNRIAPSLDTLHNLSLMAKSVSERASRAEQEAHCADAVRTAKFRTTCSALIVALWRAACSTPYMKNRKRAGTDAYRPFVCGVLYAFKRGIALPNGTVLLPECPELALALPVLRGTGGNLIAKTLHSSSHRGVCTLTRCIASVPLAEQPTFFANVARIAENFASHNFSKWDV